MSDKNIDMFLWNIQPACFQDSHINILNLEYCMTFLILNAFQNSETLYSLQNKCILREYVDLFNLLNKYREAINWNIVSELVDILGVQQLVRVVLKNLKELYGEFDIESYSAKILPYAKREKKGYLWDIKMTFLDKMFKTDVRNELIIVKQKEKAFSKDKKRIEIFENNFSKLKLQTMHPVSIYYGLQYSKKELELIICIPSIVFADIENYLFQLIIYNNILDNPYLYTLIEVVYEKEDFTSYTINTDILRDSNVLRKNNRGKKRECNYANNEEGIIVNAKIPYECMLLNYEQAKNNLAISFNWFKYMQLLTYHHMEPSPDTLYESYPLEFK